MIRLAFIFFLILIFDQALSQRVYRGIVVDSASMENLPDVHVTIKNSARGVITTEAGRFNIQANPSDTLIFTSLGYKPLVLPLLFEEDVLLIILKENIQMLAGITIKSTRLYPNKIEDRTREAPKTMDALDAIISPIDYFFWREERDRRKLSKYIRENNRTQTYRQVVTDPDVTKIMLDTYKITEEKYFALLVRFNEQRMDVHYYTDPDAIMEELHNFVEASLEKK